MSYVRQARVDRNKKLVIATLGLVIILILVAVGILLANGMFPKEQKVNFSSKAEQTNQISLLRANKAIQAGEAADVSKFEIVAVPKELVPAGVVTTMQLIKGKRVTSNLEKNEFLLQNDLVDSNAWYEEADRLMEHTFQEGAIPTTVDVGSVVDIKLFRQGAKDTIVVSKVAIIGKAQNTLCFYLNSEEQEYLKEANTEGQLFLVQYLDKAQSASIITYYPSYGKDQALRSNAESFTSTSMGKE